MAAKYPFSSLWSLEPSAWKRKEKGKTNKNCLKPCIQYVKLNKKNQFQDLLDG